MAYRAHTLEGMRHTYCACGHKGFYILTDQFVLWYVTDHDSLQQEGEIVTSDGNKLTVQPVEEPLEGEDPPEPYTIEKQERKIRIVEPATEYSTVADYTLKLTYLGPEIRKRVEDFNFEEWKTSQDER